MRKKSGTAEAEAFVSSQKRQKHFLVYKSQSLEQVRDVLARQSTCSQATTTEMSAERCEAEREREFLKRSGSCEAAPHRGGIIHGRPRVSEAERKPLPQKSGWISTQEEENMKRTAMMAAMLAAAMTVSFTGAVYAGETETSTEAATEADGAGEGTENIPGYGGFSAEDVKNASNVQPEIPEGATVLKLGTTVNENDSFQIAAVKFAQLVQDKTNGKYAIEIHPNGDLGGERDMLESMQMDTLDMGIVTSGPFVNFSQDMGVLDMPFLFADNAQAYAVFDGEVGRELLDTLESSNLKGLAYAERGFRNLTNSKKAVHSADDVKGLKIRVMENDVYTAAFKALGADAVPMNWNDTLTALQQGTVDGEENPINVINSYKLWESQKYATLDRHSYSSAIITMSLDKFNELDADTQKIFLDSAQEAAEFERAWTAAQEKDQLQAMKDNGMEVDENPDMESFKKAVQPVYDQYSQYADYVQKINDVIKDVQ